MRILQEENKMIHYPLDLASIIQSKSYEEIPQYLLSIAPLIVSAVLIVVVGFIFSNLVGKLVIKGLRAKGVDPSIHGFIRTVITLILKFIFILSALSTLNFDINSFVTALGAAGVTAGIGLQSSISQLASGVQILANHPFKSGDYIDVGTVSGKVQEIKMMYTVLVTVDNKRVIIPNSYITSNNIINYNAENRRRLDLVFSIAYDNDIALAKQTLLEVVRKNELILTDPEPLIAVKEHGASSVNLACYIWCSSDDYWDIFYYMQENVKLAFDEKKISIPFGQLDVHISKE